MKHHSSVKIHVYFQPEWKESELVNGLSPRLIYSVAVPAIGVRVLTEHALQKLVSLLAAVVLHSGACDVLC